MDQVKHRDVAIRHGSLIGIGEIFLSISRNFSSNDEFQSFLLSNQKVIDSVSNCIKDYPTEFLSDFGSDLTRVAIARFIECLSLISWPISVEMKIYWLHLLESSLDRKDDPLQYSVALAIGRFSEAYNLDATVLDRFLEMVSSVTYGFNRRRGYALVLGELDTNIYIENASVVLSCLHGALKVFVFYYCSFLE